jgi:hypothetical protein
MREDFSVTVDWGVFGLLFKEGQNCLKLRFKILCVSHHKSYKFQWFSKEKPCLQSKVLQSNFFPAKIPFFKKQKKNLAGKNFLYKE